MRYVACILMRRQVFHIIMLREARMLITVLFGKGRRRGVGVVAALFVWAFSLAPAVALEPVQRFGATQTIQAGPALYARLCANCHGRYERNLLPNRSASRIRSAIRQFPAMFELRDMTDDEIAAIAAALVTPAEPRLSQSR